MLARSSLSRTFLSAPRCLPLRASYAIPRTYSASTKPLADLDASKVTITKTASPKSLLPLEELVFGRTFTG